MPVHLINAEVYLGRGKSDKRSNVAISGGKIKSVGKSAPPSGAKRVSFGDLHEQYQDWTRGPLTEVGKRPVPKESGNLVVDCSGLRIYPGMIEPHCHITCFEDGAGPVGSQGNDTSDPNTAHLDIKDSMWPEDLAVPDARQAGITTAAVFPGSANLIGGMIVVAKMYGRTVDEMVIVEKQGLKMALGENPMRVYGQGQNKFPKTRFGNAAGIRMALDEALHYGATLDAWRKKSKAEQAKSPFKRDRKLENILGALRGEYPVRCHAHRVDDIYTAIRLSKEYGFELVLEHMTEAYKIAEYIGREKIKGTLGPYLTSRVKYELRERSTKSGGILDDNGILFAFQTDHPVLPIQTLPLAAAWAVKDGMDEASAVDSITINAAKVLGIDKRTGSIAARKDADLFITDGDLLDTRHHVLATFIDGFCVHAV
ncbi:MAG: amidohydrolase family protein [bacterium]